MSLLGLHDAHRGGDGRVAVHDAAGLPGEQRGVPEEEPGGPRPHHAVRTHGCQLPPGVHLPGGLLISLGAVGALHPGL